jgi:hypothetical protein
MPMRGFPFLSRLKPESGSWHLLVEPLSGMETGWWLSNIEMQCLQKEKAFRLEGFRRAND